MIGDDRIDRTIVGTLFALAIGLSNLGAGGGFTTRVLGAALGLVLALGLVRLWGERVRPRATLGWTLMLALLLAAGVFGGAGFQLPVVLGLVAGLFLAHDLRLGPSLLLGVPVAAVLWQPQKHWPSASEAEAWWVAGATFLGLAAALLERDRLARRVAAPVPAAWSLVRLAFLGVWTGTILVAKKELQAGALFTALGFDMRGSGGKVFLVGVLVVALAIAGLALRSKGSRPAPTP